ncbi:hypothetical protein N7495_006693 [Penicillium taxi]|uniref:uncharacterized protein n=1 Tax=Penicillium taxi TaxID=168475 RepID=UPI0025457A50|nr:uncharacterized protein N7495_006693 [Penicillium taxi]KAJ5895002.1 hypothetical protein N7495_006693 [Penicillium taxi]
MDRVVIVGAGLYGLITAKTYLEVAGVYDNGVQFKEAEIIEEIPVCFSNVKQNALIAPGCQLLVIDALSDAGGTWAEERLYPNLLSQSSYGSYEFSDMSLQPYPSEQGRGPFIPGWSINRYLHAWIEKWRLKQHIRLKWKVDSICRLESKEWRLAITITTTTPRNITIICDKLILATGLTSVPNTPIISQPETIRDPIIHAKDIGKWARENLGYRPIPDFTENTQDHQLPANISSRVTSVVIYGGAKTSFDLVHLFAKLHFKDKARYMEMVDWQRVQVHWIIRENGRGPAWMVPPTTLLPDGETGPSDKATSTRLLHYLHPCSYETPKHLLVRGWKLCLKGSWIARVLNGNFIGRIYIRKLWKSINQSIEDWAMYGSDSKMQKLRPDRSIYTCGASIGIANQLDLWKVIRSSHVKVYRSSITAIFDGEALFDCATVSLSDGTVIPDVDLVVHATGYKPVVPINFEPPSFRLTLGLLSLVNKSSHDTDNLESLQTIDGLIPFDLVSKTHIHHWEIMDQREEPRIWKSLKMAGCPRAEQSTPSWADDLDVLPYRLFRRMVAPELVASGDRSFAIVGVLLSSTVPIIAEVQALWVTAFLTGGFDDEVIEAPRHDGVLHLTTLSRKAMDRSIAEDVVLGSLTGSGLEVDSIHYNDMLMQDLGLNPNRLGGGLKREMTGVYEPSVYAGIVDEWRTSASFDSIMYGLKQIAALSFMFLSVSAKDVKQTTIGLGTDKSSRAVMVNLDDCHAINEDEVFTVSVQKYCRVFT